jgi:hypothetical protein
MRRHTHTYVTLEISASAYDEIATALRAADYGHCFNSEGEIDMAGIAVTRGADPMERRERRERRVPTTDGQGCSNCGGLHFGSVHCPFSEEQGAEFKKAMAADQSQMQSEAKT